MKYLLNQNIFACPICKNVISPTGDKFVCSICSMDYNIKDGIPFFLIEKLQNDNKFSMNYIEHYELDAELFDYFEERACQATEQDERRVHEYIDYLFPNSARVVLDVGSGNAWAAKKFCKPRVDFFSFDISLKNVSEALKRFPAENHHGVVGDAINPPFQPGTFDVVIASEIIEHILEPQQFISSLMKILKPGGKLIVSTPYKEVIRQNLCIHCNKMTPQNAHLHSFDENKLLSLYSEKDLMSKKYHIFGNKALVVMRTHIILKYLPFVIWKLADKIANLVLNKPGHIVVEYIKK
jgi:SAM-dependent methyltransferase/uncharacterized protein YbaR (Trm112 family)